MVAGRGHPSGKRVLETLPHPPFFAGEAAVGNGVYYLALPNGNPFGYYSYLSGGNYIYHFDIGYLYYSDANDGQGGIYFYDYASNHWWYTSRSYPFPYLYDFSLSSVLYYYPDTSNAGHYTTNPRYFYNFGTSSIIKLPDFGAVVWQTNGANGLGDYNLPAVGFPPAGDGQCGGPAISGHNATFTVVRDSTEPYTYDGTTNQGASSCYRNQMNPVDHSTGTNYLFTPGSHYTFTFQTVLTLHGNYLYQYVPSDNGLAVDVPAIVWQTHSYGENPGTGPCVMLVIGNTYVASVNGYTKYGTNLPPGGKPYWQFFSCSENTNDGLHTPYNSPAAYNSDDTLVDGQSDLWQIEITAAAPGQSAPIVVHRNGNVVYNNANAYTCDPTATNGCWWNFGAYMFYYETSEKPPGFTNPGINLEFDNLTLYKK